MVELRGFEPLTYCMPCSRATSCAIAPCAQRPPPQVQRAQLTGSRTSSRLPGRTRPRMPEPACSGRSSGWDRARSRRGSRPRGAEPSRSLPPSGVSECRKALPARVVTIRSAWCVASHFAVRHRGRLAAATSAGPGRRPACSPDFSTGRSPAGTRTAQPPDRRGQRRPARPVRPTTPGRRSWSSRRRSRCAGNAGRRPERTGNGQRRTARTRPWRR